MLPVPLLGISPANVKLQLTFPFICSPGASHFSPPSRVVWLPRDEEQISNQCCHCSSSSLLHTLCLAEVNLSRVGGWVEGNGGIPLLYCPAVLPCCRHAPVQWGRGVCTCRNTQQMFDKSCLRAPALIYRDIHRFLCAGWAGLCFTALLSKMNADGNTAGLVVSVLVHLAPVHMLFYCPCFHFTSKKVLPHKLHNDTIKPCRHICREHF